MPEEINDTHSPQSPLRPGRGLWAILALFCVLTAGTLFLLLWPSDAPETEPAARPAAAFPSEARTPSRTLTVQSTQQFEENLAIGIEQEIREVDYALLSTLKEKGITPDSFSLEEVVHTRENENDFLFQTIRITTANKTQDFVAALEAALRLLAPGAVLTKESETVWTVSISGKPTHRLLLSLPQRMQPEEAPAGKALLALVIDDLGEDLGFANNLAALPFPVTMAVWPLASHTSETAEVAKSSGNDLIVHQPMQPQSYPEANPGPGALFVNMGTEEVKATLNRNIDLLPGALGVNNHMGSRFTESAPGMEAVMAVLKERGLFFLDSMTTSRSVGFRQGQIAGVPVVRRNIFLDNVRDVEAIVHQLKKAERYALAHGSAIAIGHPHPETLEALSKWYGVKSSDVSTVKLHTLISR